MRKAAALVQKDAIIEALEQYEQAIKLEPGNAQIKADYEKLLSLKDDKKTQQ